MSQALTIVVAAVVLIVVSLIIITITTGVLGKFGAEQTRQTVDVSNKQASATVLAYCKAQCIVGNPGATTDLRIHDLDGTVSIEDVICNSDGTYYTVPAECEPYVEEEEEEE
ncbi:MAG: hypothetical protein KAJ47_01565 [Candidatus Aenigmarchaeota archaeon]|nr:hypothetical protein [Candidatus Aenigmarchaeota archaeon]